MPSSLATLGWVDWLLLAVLALSVLVGLVRGLVFECLSLAGWVAAWFAAQWLAPELAPHMPLGAPGGALNLGLSFAATFVAVLLAWSLLSRLVRALVRATPLSMPDRFLGALFGTLRGGVLLLAVATVVALTPASQSPDWRAAHGPRWLNQILITLKPLLPESAARLLPA